MFRESLRSLNSRSVPPPPPIIGSNGGLSQTLKLMCAVLFTQHQPSHHPHHPGGLSTTNPTRRSTVDGANNNQGSLPGSRSSLFDEGGIGRSSSSVRSNSSQRDRVKEGLTAMQIAKLALRTNIKTGQWERALESFSSLMTGKASKLSMPSASTLDMVNLAKNSSSSSSRNRGVGELAIKRALATRKQQISTVLIQGQRDIATGSLMKLCLENKRWSEALSIFTTITLAGLDVSASNYKSAVQATVMRGATAGGAKVSRGTDRKVAERQRAENEKFKTDQWGKGLQILELAAAMSPQISSRIASWSPQEHLDPDMLRFIHAASAVNGTKPRIVSLASMTSSAKDFDAVSRLSSPSSEAVDRWSRVDTLAVRRQQRTTTSSQRLSAQLSEGANTNTTSVGSEEGTSMSLSPMEVSSSETLPSSTLADADVPMLLTQLRVLSTNKLLEATAYPATVFRLMDNLLGSGSTTRRGGLEGDDGLGGGARRAVEYSPLHFFANYCKNAEELLFRRASEDFGITSQALKVPPSVIDHLADTTPKGKAEALSLVRRSLIKELNGKRILVPDAKVIINHFDRVLSQSQRRIVIILPSVLLQLLHYIFKGNETARRNARILFSTGSAVAPSLDSPSSRNGFGDRDRSHFTSASSSYSSSGVRILSVVEEMSSQDVLATLQEELAERHADIDVGTINSNEMNLRSPLSTGARLAVTSRYLSSVCRKSHVFVMSNDNETKQLCHSFNVPFGLRSSYSSMTRQQQEDGEQQQE